jgi:heterodisulfide reductase subunit C/nitrate reductase gamma subunit
LESSFHPIQGGYDIPMRVVGANIPYEWLIYILMLIPLGIFIYGAYRRIRIWRLGQGEQHRRDRPGTRIWSLISNTLAQRQVIRKPGVGWMHFLLFWGFVFLLLATAAWAMWSKINFPPMVGNTYIIASAIADITGFLAMIGIVVMAIIRYLLKPDRLNDTRSLDAWILFLIFAILFTGYIIEGARIAAQIKQSTMMEQILYEKSASPIGWIFAGIFNGSSVDGILLWHRYLWWFHMAIAFIFIAVVPFTKLWHIFTGMIAYYVRDLEPSHIRMVYNMEAAESFGVENIEEFGWKDLMDLDACIRCGRCQEACPAYNTGKLLNPKITVIQAMKEHLDKKAPYLLQSNPAPDENLALTEEKNAVISGSHEASLIYEVVTPEVLWACTNCRGCVYHCPMFIEHIDKITDMRRNLVMWQGDMPGEAQSAFTNMGLGIR